MVKFLGVAVRLIVTVGLFAALLSRLDIGRIAHILSNGSPILFGLAVAALAATNPFNAARWQLILSGHQTIRSSVLLKILFVGWFFNQMLPTGIGGDAVRAWRCKLCGMSLTTAIRSILLDRAGGYIVLVAIYAASLPKLLAIIRDPLQQRLLLLVLGMATAGLAALFLIDQLPRTVVRLRLVAPLADLSAEARRIFFDPWRAAPILGLALITAGLTVLAAEFAGRCVNVHLSFVLWLMIVPPVALFQLIPLSLGGWGVREAALVVILGKLGIPGETALAASLCVGVSQILVGLPGGLIWLNNWDIGEGGPQLGALAAAAEVPRPAVAEAGSGKREP